MKRHESATSRMQPAPINIFRELCRVFHAIFMEV